MQNTEREIRGQNLTIDFTKYIGNIDTWKFSECTFENCLFEGEVLINCIFNNCEFNDCVFDKAIFTDCIFEDCTFFDNSFHKTEFNKVHWIDDEINCNNFADAIITENFFVKVSFYMTNLEDANQMTAYKILCTDEI